GEVRGILGECADVSEWADGFREGRGVLVKGGVDRDDAALHWDGAWVDARTAVSSKSPGPSRGRPPSGSGQPASAPVGRARPAAKIELFTDIINSRFQYKRL